MKKLFSTLLSALLLLSVSACQPINDELNEESDDQDQNNTTEDSDDENESSKFINEKYGFEFVIPDGAIVRTDVGMGDPGPIEAVEYLVEFADGSSSLLSVMQSPDAFPDIRGDENLNAEEFVEKWRMLNENDTNPNTDIEVSPIFENVLNNISWFGFSVSDALVFANNVGGQLLNERLKVMVAKNSDTFYRWQFDNDTEQNTAGLLQTFRFL